MGTSVVRLLKRLLVPSHSDWLFAALILWLFASGHGWSALLADGDTGWHIRAGEFILDTGGVPRADLFSFSKPDAPWFAWEWLSDVLFASVWRLAHLKGVVLLAGVVIASYLVVLFRHMLWRGANLFLALAACLIASGASGMHYLARPHVFTLLFLAISLWIVDRGRREWGPLVWVLVPLTAVWANLHAGFLALVASLAVLAAAAAVSSEWAEARRYGLLTAACGAASLLTPYGAGLHMHVWQYLQSDWIRQAVDEFQSPKFRSESALHFEILLFSGVLAAGSLLRRREWGRAALLLFWAHAALASVRHVPVFAIVACPAIASEGTRLWRSWIDGTPHRSLARLFDGLAADFGSGARRTGLLPALVVCILMLGGSLWRWPDDFPAAKFPRAIVTRRQAQLAGTRVFTSDQWGDYLIYRFYPPQRVFIDGRSDFYGPEIGKLYLSIAYGQRDWREALDRYGFSMVLAEKEWPLVNLLRQNRGWRVLDEDARAVLFERLTPVPAFRAKENPPSGRNTLQEPEFDDHPKEARYAPGRPQRPAGPAGQATAWP